jgi:hypothetical protein
MVVEVYQTPPNFQYKGALEVDPEVFLSAPNGIMPSLLLKLVSTSNWRHNTSRDAGGRSNKPCISMSGTTVGDNCSLVLKQQCAELLHTHSVFG